MTDECEINSKIWIKDDLKEALRTLYPDVDVFEACERLRACCVSDNREAGHNPHNHDYYPNTNDHTCVCDCSLLFETWGIRQRRKDGNAVLFPIGSKCISLFKKNRHVKLVVARRKAELKEKEAEAKGETIKTLFQYVCPVCQLRCRKKDLVNVSIDYDVPDAPWSRIEACFTCEEDADRFTCSVGSCTETTIIEGGTCVNVHGICRMCHVRCANDYCEKCDKIQCWEPNCTVRVRKLGNKCGACRAKYCECGKTRGKDTFGRYYETCFDCKKDDLDKCTCGKLKQKKFKKCYSCKMNKKSYSYE